ncbi:MAG TPA: hypothetical protein VMF13_03730 [Luteitalea sp.]|nr:hypothetical protein [Luteitalea sp.]
MTRIFHRVVREQASLIDDLIADQSVGDRWRELAALMIVSAAIYGTVLGWWHGPRLASYVAVKLPLVLLLTSAFTMLFAWVAARAVGLTLRFAQVGALTFLGLATASVLLAALTPIAWLFTATAVPPPTPAARTAHNVLYLTHTVLVGMAGLAGTRNLWRALRATQASLPAVLSTYIMWLLAYALVGGEVAWVLRPFVGSVSPDFPVVFLRDDALRGNVYEFMLSDIFPYLNSR